MFSQKGLIDKKQKREFEREENKNWKQNRKKRRNLKTGLLGEQIKQKNYKIAGK